SSRWPCPRRCSDSCGRLRYENMTSSILRQCAPARVVEELGEGDDEEGEEGSHGAPLTSGRIVDGLIPRLISQDRISLRRAAERQRINDCRALLALALRAARFLARSLLTQRSRECFQRPAVMAWPQTG